MWDAIGLSFGCFHSLVPLTPGQWDVKPPFWLAHNNFHQPFGFGKVLVMFDFSTTNLLNFSGFFIINISKSSTEINCVNFHLNVFQAVLCLNYKWRGMSQTVLMVCWDYCDRQQSVLFHWVWTPVVSSAIPVLFCTRYGPLADRKASCFLSVLYLLLTDRKHKSSGQNEPHYYF